MPAPYTSALAEAVAADLLERFTRYVQIDTQSKVDREQSPSTPGQLDLSRLLRDELLALPGNVEGAPVVGFIAHVDVSPDAPAAGVKPLVHRDYDGGVITLPLGGTVLDPAQMPELKDKHGHDIVTTSGDTLLGADDKAGVAAIMSAAKHLIEHPELPRTTTRICFTPDEEIGQGATLFDIEKFGARCAYTLDGSDLGEFQDESFSAVEVRLRISGIATHPGTATGKMVSALRVAAEIVAAFPSDHLTPDTSSGREGFIHPVAFTGGADRAYVRVIVRDFDDDLLESHIALVRSTAERVVAAHPGATLSLELINQYRNMYQFIKQDPDVVLVAEEAIRAEGIEPLHTPIRGGTDGARLSERGLPTPNIFDGGYEFHSVREWASLHDMAAAAATIVRLTGAWSQRS